MSTTAPYRLVRREEPAAAPVVLDAAQQQVLEHRGGPLRVLAGPGTGKTTMLVEAVAARIDAGADPESILVLTFSRRAAAELRVRIAARVGRTMREPTARTFHSYAYGLLRRAASRAGDPPPRLLSGPEQDLMIRDLLAGQAAGEGTVTWPAELARAVGTRGFAAELRDLMLRAFERGVPPRQLEAWGRSRGRADWVAAAAFMQEYQDVTALAGAHAAALDPAELIRAAVDLLADPTELLAERERVRSVLVDEYQDTDPAQEELLQLVAGGGRDLIVVGDPDQSIYAFRGATPQALVDFPDRFPTADGEPAPTLALTTCRRSGPELLAVSRRVIGHVSGPQRTAHRRLRSQDAPPGRFGVHVLTSASQEAAFIAQQLREAHLREEVPWARMAVLVRSTTRSLSVLRRALLTAGVPVTVTGDELPLAEQPAATALLDLLDAALPPGAVGSEDWPARFDEDRAVALVTSPLGGADALALRRLRQQLRRTLTPGTPASGRLLLDALRQPGDLLLLDAATAAPARRVAELLALARTTAATEGATVEDVLWAVWQASRLGPRWQRVSRGAAGGHVGDDGGDAGGRTVGHGPRAHTHRNAGVAAAHRDLDAVVALFDTAARYVDRLPRSAPRDFLEHVRSQQLPADSLAARAPDGESVRILSAHAAKGLEWDLVVVAGVQEGQWPDLRVRGSLLGSEQLVDLVAGVDPRTASPVSALRDEEWRLFYVAVTRARRRLIVTAVESPDGDVPSRLLDALDPDVPIGGSRPHSVVPRLLSLPALVAELRAVVGDEPDPERRSRAVAQLRRLAKADVPGADPDSWWGALPLSDDRPLREPDETVRVSPSKVERFATCGLRWLLESAGGSSGASSSQSLGTLVHDVGRHAVDASVGLSDLLERMEQSWSELDFGSSWYSGHQKDKAREMLGRLHRWVVDNPRTFLAAEIDFEATFGRTLLRGRVDRLERDPDGRLVVVDLKTGSVPAAKEMPAHPQLGAYQAAVEAGGFGEKGAVSGGAELLALKSGATASVKGQGALSAGDDPEWADRLIRTVADGMAAATFVATENTQCRRCPVATSCPMVARGRQVTE